MLVGLIGSNTMARAGATISGTLTGQNSNYSGLGMQQFQGTTSAMSISKLPNSFRTALEQIEDEIRALAAEVAFCKKETQILRSEQDTIVNVAKSQTQDIEKYLDKESTILNDAITKQSLRQKAEYSRITEQVVDCRNIRDELDSTRMECVGKLIRVQHALGIDTDPNEAFLQPLSAFR